MTILTAERRRVMVVDDDPRILALVVEFLKLEDYEVIEAKDGAQAWDLAIAIEPDLIVSDVQMPAINGIELCRRLKQHPQTASIPVLLMSGSRVSADDNLEGLTAGADDYLEIPFRHEALLIKVARLTERRRVEKHYRQIIRQESLRENEERYRELVANANDIIYTHDLSGNFTSLNRSGERITGYTAEEAARMNIGDVVAPEYLNLAREMILKKTEGQVPTVYELDIIAKDGRKVRLEVSTRIILFEGKPIGVQGIARDLTERKRSEEALLEQAEREAMTNRISQAIRCSLDSDEIFQTAVRELGSYLNVDRCSLFMKDKGTQHLMNVAEYHAPGVEPAESNFDLGNLKHLAESVIKNRVIAFDEAAHDERIADVYENILKKANVMSIMYVAIESGDDIPAAFALSTTREIRRWSKSDIALVRAVADQTGIAIRQAHLFEMVSRGKQEWETTFDAMSDGIFIFDRVGILKRVNHAGAAMEHAHPRDLLGRKCCEILRTGTEATEGCVVERALATAQSVTIEITPTELNRPLLVSVEPIVDENNKTIGVVCTARDLSELRRVQAVAREHQTLLTNILESARESIYAVDTSGRFKWCNSATLAGLGYKRESFIGRKLLELVYEGDRQLVGEKLKAALNGEAQTYEMRYFSPHGRLRYAKVDNAPLVVDGQVTGVLGIARDITEQKEERERAARADKLRALGQLASGVAHDFNNSLAAILGRAQLIRRQTQDQALVRNIEIIQTAAEDAAATVRRIQTFARTSPVKEFEMFDVRSLLSDAIEITRTRWQNEARLRGLDYEVGLDAALGQYAYGSASELREVFVNLIVNAVDAMPGGGKLSISCEHQGDKLRLQFADSGVGMPEDMCQKIFEPFFTTKGAHGTGLGLSVSYSIIERHEGSISVKSEPGQGTIFTIHLPACEITSAEVNASPNPDEGVPLSILVIDDEPSVRETLADMLEILNHKVVMAESGHEALQKLAISDFDLVFTDLAMPEMDGWETAREIRKRCPEMSIVLVTGYGPGTEPPAGEGHLVNGIIGKPFDFDQVSQTIAQVTEQKTLEKVGA
ncbi:MAG TPA: PAS domain S-box protein [Pyrinomonadaceae bacterium]|nr:PAS domain S-box protein [Pyrinomonadaceae bacterium]